MGVAEQNSVIVSNRRTNERPHSRSKDARILRTRSRIDAAFVQLLNRRPYGNIRVSNIIRKAGVGRATFYSHYSAKDDLLRSQFNRIVAPMLVASPTTPPLLDASRFFAHIRSAPNLYAALMGPNAGTAPMVLRNCIETRARNVLSLDSGSKPGLMQATLSRVVASSLIAVTECWLEHGGRETPQQMQSLFAHLVGPALRTSRKPAL